MNGEKCVPDELLYFLYGMKLIETNAITKQVQKRTHRKRRINKKWLKRYGYKTVPDDTKLLVMGDCIYATPCGAKRIMKMLRKENELKPNCLICQNCICKDMHPLAQEKYMNMCLHNGRSCFVSPPKKEDEDAEG